MDNSSAEKVVLIRSMYEVFGRSLSSGAVKLAMTALRDVDAGDLEIALNSLMRDSRFMPSISDILNQIDKASIETPVAVGVMSAEDVDAYLERIEQED